MDYTYLASAVPGTVYGLLEAHKNFGRLDLEEIMKPVIAQAEEGIVVSSDLSYVIGVTPQLKSDKESYSIFFDNDEPLKEFSVIKRPDLEFLSVDPAITNISIFFHLIFLRLKISSIAFFGNP